VFDCEGIFGNAVELINAVNFGLRNNIALSVEIGAASSIQVSAVSGEMCGRSVWSSVAFGSLWAFNPH